MIPSHLIPSHQSGPTGYRPGEAFSDAGRRILGWSDLRQQQQVTRVYDAVSGPLPLEPASLKTDGGLLYFYCSGSGHLVDAKGVFPEALGMDVLLDHQVVGSARATSIHPLQTSFSTRFPVLGLAPGRHRVELRPTRAARTLVGGLFSVVVVEFDQTAD